MDRRSYTETEGRVPFDWHEFLAQDVKDILLGPLNKARALSSSWVTCGCGVQCARLERDHDGAPRDEELYSLGIRFMTTMLKMYHDYERYYQMDQHRLSAIDILCEIEERSSYLLALPT